jgi:hypothetical protein
MRYCPKCSEDPDLVHHNHGTDAMSLPWPVALYRWLIQKATESGEKQRLRLESGEKQRLGASTPEKFVAELRIPAATQPPAPSSM